MSLQLDPTGLYWGEAMLTNTRKPQRRRYHTVSRDISNWGEEPLFRKMTQVKNKKTRGIQRKKKKKKDLEARVFLMKAAAKRGGEETQRSAVSFWSRHKKTASNYNTVVRPRGLGFR
jgi:hypothetical protein